MKIAQKAIRHMLRKEINMFRQFRSVKNIFVSASKGELTVSQLNEFRKLREGASPDEKKLIASARKQIIEEQKIGISEAFKREVEFKMGRFKPIRQVRVSEEVLSQLKESILLGKFKSGEKLPSERELTEEFQVSRGVIREAIRALEITGFVVLRQGPTGGAFVTDLSFDHVGNAFLDLFLANKVSIPELANVRYYIEPEVARLAALNATQEDRR